MHARKNHDFATFLLDSLNKMDVFLSGGGVTCPTIYLFSSISPKWTKALLTEIDRQRSTKFQLRHGQTQGGRDLVHTRLASRRCRVF
jgi:hypothetical protein